MEECERPIRAERRTRLKIAVIFSQTTTRLQVELPARRSAHPVRELPRPRITSYSER